MNEEIKVGNKGSITRTISESDNYLFGGLIGNCAPWHFDEEFCKKTPFKTRIVYGMLVASLFGTAMERVFPKSNVVYLKQETNFLAPVKIGDTVTAQCEILEIDDRNIKLRTTAMNQEGTIAVDGYAILRTMKISK